jgi:hypothetical protein
MQVYITAMWSMQSFISNVTVKMLTTQTLDMVWFILVTLDMAAKIQPNL